MPNKQYRVNRLYLSGKGKNKFFEGDIIRGRQLENVEEKIKDGSIVPVEVDDYSLGLTDAHKKEIDRRMNPSSGIETETETETETESIPLFSFVKDGKKIDVHPDTDLDTPGLTKALISSELLKSGASFDPSDKKTDLFSILVDSLK